MNRRGTKATSSSKLARSTTATDKDGKPCARRMERKLSLQKINTTSCCRTLQDSRPTGSRTEDRHAACKAAPTPSGFIGPEWNDSTRISPRDRKPCRNWVQSKKNTFTKSTKNDHIAKDIRATDNQAARFLFSVQTYLLLARVFRHGKSFSNLASESEIRGLAVASRMVSSHLLDPRLLKP
ncbi:uncharacterized protein LOC119406928 isoform X1 [Rhipicephalus sanguineus]|uniref:uncharacterized protein LOC119406928 isoform X1 n=1 Tax=Rhipicephalus sanguineus TaxID=34632 RepID=UPI0018953C9B|nr:uncharacterized protein LOC119406928 isoform X1 [Rhipicephalus sanguineus]